MNRNSNISKGSSAYEIGRHPALRWRTIFIALVLALAIGSASQIPPVQAAPDNPADVYFEVGAYPDAPPPLCINQNLQIYVSVSRGIVKTFNDKKLSLPRGSVTGVDVRGSMTNNIGKLTPPDTSPVQLIDFRQGNADFLFTATKVGTTILIFNADVPGAWTGSAEALALGKTYPARKAEIKIEVRNCKFKVIATSRMAKCYVGGCLNFLGVATGQVTADENGSFTGIAQVYWTTGANIFGCTSSATMGNGNVNMHGNLNESGPLFLELDYEPVPWNLVKSCAGKSIPESYTETVTPLRVTVRSTTAVTVALNQTLSDEAGSIDGSATIVVIPEEDQAVAFNTDSRAALSPSAWMAMLWNDFPWYYNAPLALH
jgi:hypothetical protein